MGFENNVYGNNHPENSYNLENEERDRKDMEKQNRINNPKGNRPFMPIEEIPDEDAEEDVYAHVEASLNQDGESKNGFEFDKFGFVQVLEDYFDKISDDKKEDLFKRINDFLGEYRKILDNAKDEKTALKQANKAFYKIIGQEVSNYNFETGKTSFDLERPEFIKVYDKKAPINAIKVEYDKHGRPVDPDKKNKKGNQKIKSVKSGLKLPWRKR